MNDTARFLAALFDHDDIVEVRILPERHSIWSTPADFEGIESDLKRRNDAGQNIYIGANPRRAKGGTTAEDVALARAVCADFDNGTTPAEALARVAAAGLPLPTVVVMTGGGAHCWWRLTEPIHDLTRWTAIQKAIIQATGSDKAIHDPPRIMRLPGFRNCKTKYPDKPMAVIVDCVAERVHPVTAFDALLSSVPAVPRVTTSAAVAPGSMSEHSRRFLENGTVDADGRVVTAFKVACDLAGRGWSEAGAADAIVARLQSLGIEGDELADIPRQVHNAFKAPRDPRGGSAAAPPAVAPAVASTTSPSSVSRLVSLADAIERWRKQERPPVVETGFTPLDDAGGGGLPVGGLTVFAGAPGVGKSALALQATLGALRVEPTLRATWAAGEMTVEGIAQRAVVNWAAWAERRVSMTGAADRSKAALAVATDLETAVGDRLQLLPAPLPVQDIIDAVAATGSKLLVVDFIQLVEVAGTTDRRHEVDAVVRALRTLALERGVAVVMLSNIAKNVGGDARAGVVGKESSEVDFAADLLFLGVDGEPDGDARGRPVRWRCLKNRNGERLDLETTFTGSRQWFDHEATVKPHDEFADFAPAGGKAR